jgi:hypothetical protein
VDWIQLAKDYVQWLSLANTLWTLNSVKDMKYLGWRSYCAVLKMNTTLWISNFHRQKLHSVDWNEVVTYGDRERREGDYAFMTYSMVLWRVLVIIDGVRFGKGFINTICNNSYLQRESNLMSPSCEPGLGGGGSWVPGVVASSVPRSAILHSLWNGRTGETVWRTNGCLIFYCIFSRIIYAFLSNSLNLGTGWSTFAEYAM